MGCENTRCSRFVHVLKSLRGVRCRLFIENETVITCIIMDVEDDFVRVLEANSDRIVVVRLGCICYVEEPSGFPQFDCATTGIPMSDC